MRQVTITTELSACVEDVWELLSNTHHYPRFIAYLHYVEPVGKLRKGANWFDITTILWIPLKINHTVTVFRKHKQLTNSLEFPFNGWMTQDFILAEKKGRTIIQTQVTFDLGNVILNTVLGPIHKKRVESMLDKTSHNFQKLHSKSVS